jgi:penicillin G amidase
MRGRNVALAVAALAAALAPGAQARTLEARAVLPPGQSGYVSITGLPTGTGSPHLTDQVDEFVNFEYRPFEFGQPGETEAPRPGVQIVRDSYGIPSITGQSDYDAWWGVGYAVAQDRLFQLELFKRATSGRLAEILGPGFLDDDLIARRDYYTDAELQGMIARIPAPLRARTEAYRDGVNAWVDHVRSNPQDLPGEFAALGVPVSDWSVEDTARVGVFLARTVPSGDGVELENAQALDRMSSKDFKILHPVRTPGRRITVPRSEGKFPAQPGRTKRDERIGFRRSRKFLERIDLSDVRNTVEDVTAEAGTRAADPGADLRRLLPSPGGSFMWAIADGRRSYQFNGPQLGYSIPELFVEFEIHSPEFPEIRGVSAAGIPLVGIGHNGHVAWGFTSGLSDEDDLYVEKLTGPESYRFKGTERQMECRDETFTYNTPATDLPDLIEGGGGSPSGEVTARICRTVHGPVQHVGERVVLSRRYAIWGRELETFKGLDMLNKAETVADIDRAMRKVTWNENVLAADDRGGIGYWHPGLHQLRPKRWDERLPLPGTGKAEWRGLLPRRKTPHVVNPERGWLANWNNPPSAGWTNGDGVARERLAGPFHRVRILEREVKQVARNPSYDRHTTIVRTTGTTAQQFPFAPEGKLRRARRELAGPAGRATLRELGRWNGSYHETAADGTVAPGVAIWEVFKAQLQAELIRPMGAGAELLTGGTGSSHGFDISNGEAAAMRLLGARGYARAANRAAEVLAERFGSQDPATWREPRQMYEVEAMGAGQVDDIPFFDRGTWEQSVMLGTGGG